MPSNKNILLIGATGGTGRESLQQLAQHPSQPKLHALVRDPTRLDDMAKLLTTITTGNARNENDVIAALRESQADFVIMSIGNGDDLSKTDLRTKSAQALARALAMPEFEKVQVLCVSSHGAGGSRIIVGMGMGRLIERYIRNILKDHNGQEAALEPFLDRTTIVRPTALTVDKPAARLTTFGDKAKAPTIQTDRADLAAWIVHQICDSDKPLGHLAVNLTGLKK